MTYHDLSMNLPKSQANLCSEMNVDASKATLSKGRQVEVRTWESPQCEIRKKRWFHLELSDSMLRCAFGTSSILNHLRFWRAIWTGMAKRLNTCVFYFKRVYYVSVFRAEGDSCHILSGLIMSLRRMQPWNLNELWIRITFCWKSRWRMDPLQWMMCAS